MAEGRPEKGNRARSEALNSRGMRQRWVDRGEGGRKRLRQVVRIGRRRVGTRGFCQDVAGGDGTLEKRAWNGSRGADNLSRKISRQLLGRWLDQGRARGC